MNYELPYVATFKKVSFTQFKKDILNLFEDYFTTAYTNEAELDKQLLLIYNDIKIPTRSTTGAAGYDFYLPFTVPLKKSDNYVKIPTGIKCEIEDGYVLILAPRSSAGIKSGVQLRNTIGVIDSDYYNNKSNEGHILLACTSDSYPLAESKSFNSEYFFSTTFEKDVRIVQGMFLPYFVATNDKYNDDLKVREGGTGSTGV